MEEEVRKELNRLKEEIAEFERKYFFTGNYKLIASILDKLDIDNLVINYKELNKKPLPLYIVKFNDKEKTATIKRYKNE